MKHNDSAIASLSTPLSRPAHPHAGLLWGSLGVLAFSFTVPFTRVAVRDLEPLLVTGGRAVIAGTLAALLLLATRSRRPTRTEWLRLLCVAGGVVLGFPLFTSLALREVPASHAAVVVGLLPAVTAAFTVVRTREHVGPRFWACALLGAAVVTAFVARTSGGLGHLGAADLWLLAAVVTCAIGYTEGGLLSRSLGSWQTICWGLVLSLPVLAPLTLVSLVAHPPHAAATSWAAFAYLSVISMFLGFFAWYRGLAIGPMAHVSQVQLVQPLLSLTWAAIVLGERLDPTIGIAALAVIGCAWFAVRARSGAQRGGSASEQTGLAQEPSDLGAVDAPHEPLAQGRRDGERELLAVAEPRTCGEQ